MIKLDFIECCIVFVILGFAFFSAYVFEAPIDYIINFILGFRLYDIILNKRIYEQRNHIAE